MAGGLKSAAARSHLRANAGVSDAPEVLKLHRHSSKATVKLPMVSLQQMTPIKLLLKVPFKVCNVTLVTIAWGGTHLTMAELVFYLGETTLQRVKCVFFHTARAR